VFEGYHGREGALVIPFQLHRRIPLVRRPFLQRDRAMEQRDQALRDRDAAIAGQSAIWQITPDVCVQEPPSPQLAIDLVAGWVSNIPGVNAGTANLFDDGRTSWAIERLGSLRGSSVLELGPLEGGHTYMLHNEGATITAIEAGKRAFLKCLIVKELFRLERAHFMLGDFMPWLAAEPRRFDLVWMTGVLYHMMDPVRLLHLVAACTDKLHIFTHYVPDDFDPLEAWAAPIVGVEDRPIGDRTIRHYVRSYRDEAQSKTYCGGVYTTSVWLRRSDILEELTRRGFLDIEIGFDSPAHPHGPCFAIVAKRVAARD
jgi:hypothetical protein